jgi:hypothetical protein
MSTIMPSPRFDYFIDQCRIHHATRKTFSGLTCLKHWRAIAELAARHECRSALDYGCGKGLQYETPACDGLTLEQVLGFSVAKYDPALARFAGRLDGPFDLVWCVDVMEHIDELDVDWVIDDLLAYAERALLVTIACYPAKKHLPDGRNAHLTVRPAEWWRTRFSERIATFAKPAPHLLLLAE